MTDRADEIAERLGETLCDCLYGEDGTPCTAVRSEGFTLAITRREAAPLIRAYGDEREREAFEAGVQAGMSYENALWQPPAGEDPPFPIYDDWATVARSVAPKERP